MPTTTSSRRSRSRNKTAEAANELDAETLVQALQANGWAVTHRRGTHVCLTRGSRLTIIPVQPGRALPLITLKAIISDVDIYD